MAIVQALIAALARSAGRLLNTAFGWATVMVFGKVPEDRQIYLSLVAFGSVLWIVVVAGIAFPSVGTFLLAFVPLPEWVSRGLVRLAMLGLAIVLPAFVGAVSLLLKDPDERPQTAAARIRTIARGYPFTLGLATTLILMTLFAPVLRLRGLVRRWTGAHVPMLVEAEDYESVVAELGDHLRQAGWDTRRVPASWMLRIPTRVLTTLAGGAADDLVAKRLTTLQTERLEVTLHPSDLVIQGRKSDVIHARAALAEHLALSRAHLTWSKEGNELEDRLRASWRDFQSDAADRELTLGRLATIEEELRRVEVSYEEWEVLFRAKCLAEATVYRVSGAAQRESRLPRTVVPLGLAVVHRMLESPRVAVRLERLVMRLLGRLERRAARRAGRRRAQPTPLPEPRAARRVA